MAELKLTHIVLLTLAVLAGLVAGWLVRGRRSLGEKAAINAGWREQIAAERSEHERLIEQNRSLMQQNSRHQASDEDSRARAAELSAALREALEGREELQRQNREIRGSLEAVLRERDRVPGDVGHPGTAADEAAAIAQRDARIAQLSKELTGWHERVPPLIERFRVRNQEALELEEGLANARSRVAALEAMLGPQHSGVAPHPAQAVVSAAAGMADACPAGTAWPGEPEDNERPEAGGDTMAATSGGLGRDNLKRIKGVGPAIEKTLNEIGIWRFSQIATMSEYEMDRVAQRLRGFRSRIYREDWIGQARELDERKARGSD